MRFKSHPSISPSFGGLWLYATHTDVRADDVYYTCWAQCDEVLIDQSSDLCRTRTFPGDNIGDYDVELAKCSGGGDQCWRIESAGGYDKIKNADEDCCIDVFSGDTS